MTAAGIARQHLQGCDWTTCVDDVGFVTALLTRWNSICALISTSPLRVSPMVDSSRTSSRCHYLTESLRLRLSLAASTQAL